MREFELLINDVRTIKISMFDIMQWYIYIIALYQYEIIVGIIYKYVLINIS